MHYHPLGDNKLLASLPTPLREHLRPRLRHTSFAKDKTLYEPGSRVESTYFPLAGTLSAVVVMRNGTMIEVSTVGNEGAAGLPTNDSPPWSPHRVYCQIPGDALCMETTLLAQAINNSLEAKSLFNAYQSSFLFQVSQSVACNGLHRLEERCCRWLLTRHDRLHSDEIPLTHEYVASMLGVRRSGVTDVLQELTKKGMIRTERGNVIVVDRDALEAAACECYDAVRKEYHRLLG